MALKLRKIKFNPRIKLNHNIQNLLMGLFSNNCLIILSCLVIVIIVFFFKCNLKVSHVVTESSKN